jgi:hypothetical protein
MRKLVWIMILPLLLAAQQDKKKALKEEKKEAAGPTAAADGPLEGTIDVGTRWVSAVSGDFNTYRSIVNLGQGIRLIGMDLRSERLNSKLLDSMMLQSYNWGGDPFNSARLDMKKDGLYRFVGSYANIAQFNMLPSFANPGANHDLMFNQRAFDTNIRNMDNELQLFPGGRITPYLALSRNTMYGTGISTLVSLGNEYPLQNLLRWGQEVYRSGARLERERMHATVEIGSLVIRDDQAVGGAWQMRGNRIAPYLGRTLALDTGTQAYKMFGYAFFGKGFLTMNPWHWLDITGQFYYVRPRLDAHFVQFEAGTIADRDPALLFVNRAMDTITGSAVLPRTSGAASAEIRPFSRLRIRQVFETDSFHDDSRSLMSRQMLIGARTVSRTEPGVDRLDVTQRRQQVEALADVGRLTFRGGYRREWGRALLRSGLTAFEPFQRGEILRHVTLGGVQARPWQRLTLNLDVEAADGVKTFFRTGLMDTVRIRAMGRVSLPGSLFLNLQHLNFTNRNPAEGVHFDFRVQSTSAGLQWMPKGGKHFSLLAEYLRSAIRSDINFFVPFPFEVARSLYRDNAHSGTLLADITMPGKHGMKLSAGGSFIATSGSRPSRYFQPIGRLVLPVHPRLHLYSEWRWFGLHQPFYGFEGFRNHLVLSGIRLLM